MIDLIFGPLGAILGIIVSAMATWLAGRSSGKSSVERKLDKAYRDERKEIDNEDLGLGATDATRVERLRKMSGHRER